MLKSVLTTAVAGTLALAGLAQAATITYDFSGTAGTVPAGWVKGTGDSFALDGNGHYVDSMSAGNTGEAIDVSIFHVADRQAGTDFSMSTTFTVTARSISGTTAGWNMAPSLRFLAWSGTDDTATGRSYYVLSLTQNNAGSFISIGKAGTGALAANETDFAQAIPVLNTAYTLSVSGTYLTGVDAGKLKMDYSLTSGATTIATGSVTDANPLAGEYYGLRQRAKNFGDGTISQTTSFDQVDLTYSQVPEPGTLSLMGMAGLYLLRRRRR